MGYREVTIKHKETIAEDTVAFGLEKPKDFKFTAGQFIRLKIIQPKETDERGDSQQFSLASAPYEDLLLVATRKGKSAFKRNLMELSVEDKVEIMGPLGKFTLHDDVSYPAVFLVGGIGITPVRSILRDAAYRKLQHKFYLFYSNRKPEAAAFLTELQQIEDLDYQFIGTMTNLEDSQKGWQGERGYIDLPLLEKYIDDLATPIYYIVGPSNFVKAMKQMLLDEEIDDSKMKQEYFEGYP